MGEGAKPDTGATPDDREDAMSTIGMKLKIRQASINPGSARIWLNDTDISSGLTSISVDWEAADITRARLEISVSDLDIDTDTLAVLAVHVAETERDRRNRDHVPPRRCIDLPKFRTA